MKKKILMVFGMLAFIAILSLNINDNNAAADGGIDCDCALFRKGCFANGWGANCAPEGTTNCREFDENCVQDPE